MDRFRNQIGVAARAARQIGAWRLLRTAAFLLLALLVARYGWQVPLLVDAERALYDARSAAAQPRVDQDGRIALVVYDDETLRVTGKRSPLDRAVLARALTQLDAMGAKAIGVDILIDQAQPEDPQLIAALRAMRTPVYLGFAGSATNADSVLDWQEGFMRRFQASLAPGNVHPGSVRIEADPDNVLRSWPTRPPGVPPLLSVAMYPRDARFADYTGSVKYRAPVSDERPVFAVLPIGLFGDADTAPLLRDQIAGRYVFVGAEIADTDQFDTPASRLTGRMTWGVEIHAAMLAQMLDGQFPRALPDWSLWLAALALVLLGGAIGARDQSSRAMATELIGSAILIVTLPWALERGGWDTQGVPMFGWMLGWLIAFVAVGAAARAVGSARRRFAQATLGRYLPVDVARQIIADPDRLTLQGEKREIYALFSDLEGFTKLSHRIPPETVATLLNRYLDLLSEVVLAHGGTLDKFVGDAVVAFWGAPIARADDADRAVRAAVALYQAGERFRAEVDPALPPVGRTRVGLHHGEAIVGNFGGEGRIQYTALGDSMNTAARLESANKPLSTTVLVSDSVVARTSLDIFRPMGRVTVRGRSTPIAVYEAVPDLDPAVRAQVTQAVATFDAGDSNALDTLSVLSAKRPDDAALACLLTRLVAAGPGGHYALD
ncbi:adenylate/guanylate cyclase domain-containing protein [Sphingomonas adhaesiva]|uniref:adenylate/guanylate cyclase domain-containing protein n=1 Tax=Sphingomonas adhaesiva TaxID=28212 RepID=UPI002FF55A78